MFCTPGEFKSRRLAKQNKIRDFLKVQRDDATIWPKALKWVSTDRMVDSGMCGKERPDFLFDCGTHFLVIECDEHQHRNSQCACEQTRMINVHESLGMPTFWIRFNPDQWIDDEKNKKKKHGGLEDSNWNLTKRLDILWQWVNFATKYAPQEEWNLHVVYLFFDGFSEGQTCTQLILTDLEDILV